VIGQAMMAACRTGEGKERKESRISLH